MVDIIHKPQTAYIYKSPKPPPHLWSFPKVEQQLLHSLEWALPWCILSEYSAKVLYSTVKGIKDDGKFWNPITVWTLPDGSFHLWHGKSRYIWSKILDLEFDVVIIDQYGVDVTTNFPQAEIHPDDSICVDYRKRKQENGEIVFKMVLRNEERQYADDDENMFKYYSQLDCPDYDRILKTKPGIKYYVDNKFMFKWGNEKNTVDLHYDNVVDCLRRTLEHWEVL